MDKLLRGIARFRTEALPAYRQRFRDIAAAQNPDVLFITCADSRVVPHLLVSTGPGELFVVRNVGNLIPPATPDVTAQGLSEPAALEFAVLTLNVRAIVVCGHSDCGAMKATLADPARLKGTSLASWLRNAEPSRMRCADGHLLDPSLAPHDQLSQVNVLQQLEHLKSYEFVQSRIASGHLALHAWWFEIDTANVLVFNSEQGRFRSFDAPVPADSSDDTHSKPVLSIAAQ